MIGWAAIGAPARDDGLEARQVVAGDEAVDAGERLRAGGRVGAVDQHQHLRGRSAHAVVVEPRRDDDGDPRAAGADLLARVLGIGR